MKTICLTLTLAEGSPTAELISQRRSPQAVSAVPSAICCLPPHPPPALPAPLACCRRLPGLWPPPDHPLIQWFALGVLIKLTPFHLCRGQRHLPLQASLAVDTSKDGATPAATPAGFSPSPWGHPALGRHFGVAEPTPRIFPSTSSVLSQPEMEKPPPKR